MRYLAIVPLIIISVLLIGCTTGLPAIPGILATGSGTSVTRAYDIVDFNSVSASSAFNVEITQAPAFGVTVTVNEEYIDDVRIEKIGSTLRIGLDSSRLRGYRTGVLIARVTMPRLEELELSGAAHGSVDFDANGEVSLRISGASSLEGRLDARHVKFDVSGASSVKGLGGAADSMMVAGSGASRIDLRDYRAGTARLELSGGSSARVEISELLEYDLSGGAHLDYSGNPLVGTARVSSGAAAKSR